MDNALHRPYGHNPMERIADFRQVFAKAVVARAGCPDNQRLLHAFMRVERHHFLGPGPWTVCQDGTKTIDDDPAVVYQDMGSARARHPDRPAEPACLAPPPRSPRARRSRDAGAKHAMDAARSLAHRS
jgi:hypothetical protein